MKVQGDGIAIRIDTPDVLASGARFTVLHWLGIAAEPPLAHSGQGDKVHGRLPGTMKLSKITSRKLSDAPPASTSA